MQIHAIQWFEEFNFGLISHYLSLVDGDGDRATA